MKKHILLEKAYRYPEPQGSLEPEGCTFSEQSGYWVKTNTDKPMVRSDDPKKPQSKKCDRETGEDQKGE